MSVSSLYRQQMMMATASSPEPTEYIFYPGQNGTNDPADGYIQAVKIPSTWSDLVNAVGTTYNVLQTQTIMPMAYQMLSDSPSQYIALQRAFFSFDTSTLPAGTIVGATITLTGFFGGNARLGPDGDFWRAWLVTANPASTSSLTGTDYTTVGSTLLADIADANDTQSPVFALNAAGIAHINRSGVSSFATRLEGDVLNHALAFDDRFDYWRWKTSEDSGNEPPDFISAPVLSVLIDEGSPEPVVPKLLFTSNQTDEILIYNLAGTELTLEKTLSFGANMDGPKGIAADESYYYVACHSGTNKMIKIAKSTDSIVATSADTAANQKLVLDATRTLGNIGSGFYTNNRSDVVRTSTSWFPTGLAGHYIYSYSQGDDGIIYATGFDSPSYYLYSFNPSTDETFEVRLASPDDTTKKYAAISPDGKYGVSRYSSSDKTFYIWDWATQASINTVDEGPLTDSINGSWQIYGDNFYVHANTEIWVLPNYRTAVVGDWVLAVSGLTAHPYNNITIDLMP